MGENEVFEPRSAGRALAVVAFPLLSAVCVLLGVVAVLQLSPIVGMILFIGCLLLAGLPLLVMAAVLRGSFTLNVDDDGLILVGVLGGRVKLPWAEQAAVGLAAYRGATMLAVRPLEPPKRAPRRSMVWDRQTGLLMISGLDNWSAPRDEVVEAVRRFAGPLWTPSFDTVHPY
jgi:hypothetical protein